MVEVYNESVYDLLVSPEEGHEKLQLQKKGNDVIVPVSIVIGCVKCIILLVVCIRLEPLQKNNYYYINCTNFLTCKV
jgi:sporulation protein YlmC with PRC-barrel domain